MIFEMVEVLKAIALKLLGRRNSQVAFLTDIESW